MCTEAEKIRKNPKHKPYLLFYYQKIMKDSARKAMFAKGKKEYPSWYQTKFTMRELAKENNLKNMPDWKKFRVTNKKPNMITKYPERVYSKQNIIANQKAGIDIKKHIFY